MSLQHYSFAITSLLVAFLTVHLLLRLKPAQQLAVRFETIDGLRGYLAFFVFLHHSSIWYFYLRSGLWTLPPANLFIHFGQSSVALFFMITGFLFFTKLLRGQHKEIDWTKLYVSRVLRLVPMYVVAIGLFFIVIGALSGWEVRESFSQLFYGASSWLGFTILGYPDLNGVKNSSIILAGVTWSLPYEWLFYFSLPFLGYFIKSKISYRYLFFSFLIIVITLCLWNPSSNHLVAFLGGILASYLLERQKYQLFFQSRRASILAVASLLMTFFFFPTSYGFIQMILLSFAFCVIANGNDLFGILRWPTSRLFGDLTYSLYLLHGLILFTLFHFLVGPERAASLSISEHWGLILLLTPFLVLISFTTYHFIEEPAMRQVSIVSSWIQNLNLRSNFDIFNPAFIFIFVWGMQIVGYVTYKETLGIYAAITWCVLIVGVLSFILGSAFTHSITKSKRFALIKFQPSSLSEIQSEKLIKFSKWILLLYSLLTLIVLVKILFVYNSMLGVNERTLSSFRNIFVNDFYNERRFYELFRIFHFGIAICLFLLSLVGTRSKKLMICIVALGFFSALFTTSRFFLLLITISNLVIFYSKGLIKKRGVFVTIAIFTFVFFAWALLYGKGHREEPLLAFISKHIQDYLLSGFSAFNYFIVNNKPRLDSLIIIPNSIKIILNYFGFNLSMRPNFNPEVFTPIHTNVFTFFYPLYHDGGMALVAIGCFVLGFVHQLIYLLNKIQTSPVRLYIFSISLYPLVLTFFEDAYFSSPGFWLTLLSPVIFYKLILRFTRVAG